MKVASEWVPFENAEELKEAEAYLLLWMKFFVIKHPDFELVDKSEFILKPGIDDLFLKHPKTIALKLIFKEKSHEMRLVREKIS